MVLAWLFWRSVNALEVVVKKQLVVAKQIVPERLIIEKSAWEIDTVRVSPLTDPAANMLVDNATVFKGAAALSCRTMAEMTKLLLLIASEKVRTNC